MTIAAAAGLFMATGCSDMLESESSRQLFDPELNQKTDSVFYAYGIMKAMQQAGDQYFFQGEMRGDNVRLTEYTDSMLRQMYNFEATTANKYDSAYQYYRIINNCNYYIAHRDTNLMTGSEKVTMHEYAAVHAFRAWAYLQLARNYGTVPFFTEPVTKISEINNNNYPELGLSDIVNALAPEMEKWTGYTVPTYGVSNFAAGSTNAGSSKTVVPECCFIPVDVILGEMYLEVGEYEKAVNHYATYLNRVASFDDATRTFYGDFSAATGSSRRRGGGGGIDMSTVPSDFNYEKNTMSLSGVDWTSIFNANSTNDIITYIPMAVNAQMGTTTEVPTAFGYDYYAMSRSEATLDELQVNPSYGYLNQVENEPYYYFTTRSYNNDNINYIVSSTNSIGETRSLGILDYDDEDTSLVYVDKFKSGNIILYRYTTVLLHLAEAVNRMGYPDLAFGILKYGISPEILNGEENSYKDIIDEDGDTTKNVRTYWMSEEAVDLLETLFFNSTYAERWDNAAYPKYMGVHDRGSGRDAVSTDSSSYSWDNVVLGKMESIATEYGKDVDYNDFEQYVNAVEELLYDEYRFEFAFEGTRYYDMMRLARHKNETGCLRR